MKPGEKYIFGALALLSGGLLYLNLKADTFVRWFLPDQNSGTPVAYLSPKEGSSYFKNAGPFVWTAATQEAELHENSSVLTHEGGTVAIRFHSGDAVEVGESSLVVIDADRSGPNDHIRLRQSFGSSQITAPFTGEIIVGDQIVQITSGPPGSKLKIAVQDEAALVTGDENFKVLIDKRPYPIRRGESLHLADHQVQRSKEKSLPTQAEPATNRIFLADKTGDAVKVEFNSSEFKGPLKVEVAADRQFSEPVFTKEETLLPVTASLPAGRYFWRLEQSGQRTKPRSFHIVPSEGISTTSKAIGASLALPNPAPVAPEVEPEPPAKKSTSTRRMTPPPSAPKAPTAPPPQAPLPPAPVLTLPADNAVIASANKRATPILFRWRKSSGFTGYQLVIASDEQFDQIFSDQQTAKDFVHIPILIKSMLYWRVRGISPDGRKSEWSKTRRLRSG